MAFGKRSRSGEKENPIDEDNIPVFSGALGSFSRDWTGNRSWEKRETVIYSEGESRTNNDLRLAEH